MNDIEQSLENAKKPGGIVCPVCNEELFSLMDKLSIYLFDKCTIHLEDDSKDEKNLFKIAEVL